MSTYQNDSNSKSKILPWLIAGLVALGGLNIAQWFSGSKKADQIAAQATEIDKSTELNTQLEQQYKDAIAQLEEMKGKNTELNAEIDKKKEELAARKSQISGMISKKDYNKVVAEMARFKEEAAGYMAQIAQLEQEKKQLGEQVNVLTTEKTSLQDNLKKETAAKEEVIAAKTSVEAEKAKVEADRAILKTKAEAGAVVRVANIQMQGFKVRESGKERERTHAKNIDRLKFCFKALPSPDQAERGNETFYVRIIDPTGVAIATQAGGGGVTKLADGREIQYTTTKQIDVKNNQEDVCTVWDAKGNAVMQKGKFVVEIYNKGYLAGRNEFDLK